MRADVRDHRGGSCRHPEPDVEGRHRRPYVNELSWVPGDMNAISLDYSYNMRAVIRYRDMMGVVPFKDWLRVPGVRLADVSRVHARLRDVRRQRVLVPHPLRARQGGVPRPRAAGHGTSRTSSATSRAHLRAQRLPPGRARLHEGFVKGLKDQPAQPDRVRVLHAAGRGVLRVPRRAISTTSRSRSPSRAMTTGCALLSARRTTRPSRSRTSSRRSSTGAAGSTCTS